MRARPEDLGLGLERLDLGVPRALLSEPRTLIDAATARLAEELAALLRRHLLHPYLAGNLPEDRRHALSGVVAQLKPLTIQAVMSAMQDAGEHGSQLAGFEGDDGLRRWCP